MPCVVLMFFKAVVSSFNKVSDCNLPGQCRPALNAITCLRHLYSPNCNNSPLCRTTSIRMVKPKKWSEHKDGGHTLITWSTPRSRAKDATRSGSSSKGSACKQGEIWWIFSVSHSADMRCALKMTQVTGWLWSVWWSRLPYVGWVDLDLGCFTILPNYTASSAKFLYSCIYMPKQNREDSGMTKIVVHPTQMRDHQNHPAEDNFEITGCSDYPASITVCHSWKLCAFRPCLSASRSYWGERRTPGWGQSG